MNFKTIAWKNDKVVLIDQRKLPREEIYMEYSDYKALASAIKNMVVRGAPAIGVAGAMGVALGALGVDAKTQEDFIIKMNKICNILISTRPTAVNLAWGVKRMQQIYLNAKDFNQEKVKQVLVQEALNIFEEDVSLCKKIGEQGEKLFEDGDTVLTHCNAGALATAGQGTALSPIYEAYRRGKKIRMFADETRPFLQGARLTAWELMKNNVEVTLIPDVAAASLMRQGLIQKVIVGADRIVANGDFANKIGTYSVALAAKTHHIPFYVAAPFSTLDWEMQSGAEIPIEERPADEVTNFFEQRTAPENVKVRNPAFDVTPNDLVTGIITERGVVSAPFKENLKKLYER
ncbi:MAG: S-methyl-5-thioribose-1-phosphate isomerase [Deltaproteobacteria bacterium]|nr:S-methyl-5-thioribose-1-phosphate isomerase [Deltaproteobacteria bacterium]